MKPDRLSTLLEIINWASVEQSKIDTNEVCNTKNMLDQGVQMGHNGGSHQTYGKVAIYCSKLIREGG